MKKILLSLCIMPVMAFAQAVLPTTWDFTTPGVANPPTGWAYNVGNNGNLTYAFGKNDALSARLDATGENIVITFAEKPGVLTYYISPQNAGKSWGGVFDVQESVDGSSWTTIRSFTSKATTATNFNDPPVVDSLKPATRFVRFYYTNKISISGGGPGGGNVALDNITVTKAPAAAIGINVKSGNNTLLNGSTFTYGNGPSRLFTIVNVGTSADLKIDSLVIDGANASDFSFGSFDSITPSNNGTDTFSLYFNPSANGSRFATLKVYSNDAEKSPYIINLYAIGGQYATEPTQVPSIAISNVRTQSLRVNFGKTTTESYMVLRKSNGTLTEVPVDGVTYKKGDYIGGAQVAYIGNDTATIRPLYILANTNYTFAAFSFNGPAGFENYNTTIAPSASATTLNGEMGTYYNGINPATSNFITQLHNKVTVHDTVFYSNYIAAMVNNYLSRDTSNGQKVVNCVYTGTPYVYDEPFTWWTGQGTNPGKLTREHSFAQSWMPTNTGGGWPNGANGREYQEYNDLHHLFPADQVIANGKRSNNPFGVVFNATYTSPTGEGKLGADSLGKTVYEPRNEHKGDLARSLFYMLICYDGVSNVQWRLPVGQDIAVLLKWHRQDPPSALEIARNEHIYTYQRNRNPFIDHPEWVDRINFSNMTYIPGSTTGSVMVTAPAANASIISGTTAAISWSSSNVDSVKVELRTSAGGAFKTLGTYLASLGTVNYQFNENATTAATIRITDSKDALVTATGANFNIVNSQLNITAPAQAQILPSYDSVWVKWNKSNVSAVNVKCYVNRGSAVIDSLILTTPITTDSVMINLPKALGATYLLYVTEVDANKNSAYLAWDTVGFTVDVLNGLTTNELNRVVSVYPVPSNGTVNVNVSAGVVINELKAFDVAGRLIQTSTQNNITLEHKGLYFLHIVTDKGTLVKKVVIE